MANLLQISSPFGRAMETVDRTRMCLSLYGPLVTALNAGEIDEAGARNAVAAAAAAEGYAFPTNLDRNPPVSGLAPESQASLMWGAMSHRLDTERFQEALRAHSDRSF